MVICRILSKRFFSDILTLLLTPSQGKEVSCVETVMAFLMSIVADVLSYFICKWLDDDGDR